MITLRDALNVMFPCMPGNSSCSLYSLKQLERSSRDVIVCSYSPLNRFMDFASITTALLLKSDVKLNPADAVEE
jgi:hypothetical protein